MDPSTTAPTSVSSTNPPSVEAAYKRKCIALKKRLNEVETENELMRLRNRRGWQYIQKMRLESCILLERLAQVTGMLDEAAQTGGAGGGGGGVNSDLRARAAAMLATTSASALNGDVAERRVKRHLEDETDGSSEDQPPTPEERPLRIKRPRKSNANNDSVEDDLHNHPGSEDVVPSSSSTTRRPGAGAASASHIGGGLGGGGEGGGGGSSLHRLAPAGVGVGAGAGVTPTQEELTSSFRIQTGISTNGSATPDGRGNYRQFGATNNSNSNNNNYNRRYSGRPLSTTATPMDMPEDEDEDLDDYEDSTDMKIPKEEERR